MKLFNVGYVTVHDDVDYLTVGTDNDPPETIAEREEKKIDDWTMGVHVWEVTEVDGYPIKILNKEE
jgi:hypothetical protein